MLFKTNKLHVTSSNIGGINVIRHRVLVITLLFCSFLLSACQLPFTGSEQGDGIEEVLTSPTNEAAAEEEGESIFAMTTPETATTEEGEDNSNADAANTDVEAADAGDSTVTEGESAATEGESAASEGESAASEGESAATEDESAAAEGENAATEDESAMSEGESAATEGESAMSEGESAATEGESASPEGESNSNEGESAATEGESNSNEGESAATEGESAAAEGESNSNEGESAATEGESAATEGESAATKGENTATEGESTSNEGESGDSGVSDGVASPSEKPQVQIIADSVQLHDGPGPYNPVVGTLAKDNTVDVMGRNLGATWYYVKVNGELNGWIPAESAQGLGSFSANDLALLKAPAIPAPTATAESGSTGGESEPTATAVSESEPTATAVSESEPTATAVAESEPTATTVVENEPTATPAPINSAFTYGIQAHLIYVDRRLPFAHTTGLGLGLIKQQIEWKEWEKTQGDINWGEMDAIVNEAQENGLQVLYSVVGAPDWAREAGFDSSVAGPPADPATFASFLGQMATRYCGQNLKAIEVWNEQNLHYEWGNQTLDPAAYMALLNPSYDAIKAACPSMTVVSGALTPAGDIGTLAIDDFTYLQGMFANGLANAADVIGAHPSGYNVPPNLRYTEACAYLEQKDPAPAFNGPCDTPHHSWSFLSTLEGYRDIIQQSGSTQKVWATEFGWAAGGSLAPGYEYADDNNLDEQAAWTVEAFQYMRDSGYVEAAVLWNLNFRTVADGTEKAQWGIVANNSQPLPAFFALQAMPK